MPHSAFQLFKEISHITDLSTKAKAPTSAKSDLSTKAKAPISAKSIYPLTNGHPQCAKKMIYE
jgi:hypothetical protein